jgi:hypothetical protein
VIRVTVNTEAPQEINCTAVTVVEVDSGEGEDSVMVGGTDEGETVHFSNGNAAISYEVVETIPDDGTSTTWDCGVFVVNAEEITFDSGGGSDLAVMRDSADDDRFKAPGAPDGPSDSQSATLNFNYLVDEDDLDLIVRSFDNDDTVRPISLLGGDDIAELGDFEYDLVLLGDWTQQ